MRLVLADTSVRVAHFRRADPLLQSLLAADQMLCHPPVWLELACGTPPTPRERTIGDLERPQHAVVATTDETLAFIEREQLHDSGCGAVDMALLASVLLTPDTLLWTIDRNLDTLATCLGVSVKDKGATVAASGTSAGL